MEGNGTPELTRAVCFDGDGNMSGSGTSRGFQGSGNGHGTQDTTAGEEMIRRRKIERGDQT